MLRETTRLTTVYLNEDKLNSVHGPTMRKNLHDSLSSDSIGLMHADQWSSNKMQTYPTRSDAKIESFENVGKIFRRRMLLETERIFFQNESEETFGESNTEIRMNLTDRDKTTLVLGPRSCWNG